MKKSLRKFLALLIAVMILGSVFVGCGSSKEAQVSTTAVESVATSPSSTPEATQEKITFTQLVVKNPNIDSLVGGDFSKTPAAMELEKRTNVHIEAIPVANEDYDTQLSLMINSGQQPDIMGLPSNYPGGSIQAVADGVLVKISDYMELTPNLKKVLASNPEWEKNAKTDDGSIISFPCIREDKSISIFSGPMIRKDLLDAAGLALPETIDEWHTALTAFKKSGVKTPLSGLNWMDGYTGAFSGAYGAINSTGSCYVGADGKMHYGPIEPGYKEFLTTMAQWYKEGLVDADFFTSEDWGGNDTKTNSGQVGATVHFISYIADYTNNISKAIPNAQFVATKHAVLKKGDQPLFGQINPPLSGTSSISAKCKDIKRAIQYMDYGYSPEGQILMNFGIEGESYTMVEGKPKYTELITATPTNSKGWNLDQSLAMYCPAANDTNTVQMKSYFEQVRVKSQGQKDALAFWSIPKYTVTTPNSSYTNAESIVARKLSDVKTYADEMRARFVMGTEPIENFDKFVARCKELGIDDVLMVNNDAYTRFNNR